MYAGTHDDPVVGAEIDVSLEFEIEYVRTQLLGQVLGDLAGLPRE
jgi:hypothetical protein